MTEPYTVHVDGDGLLEPEATQRAQCITRADACATAVQFIRDGARRAEVRQSRALMDQFVLRGRSPRRIYRHTGGR